LYGDRHLFLRNTSQSPSATIREGLAPAAQQPVPVPLAPLLPCSCRAAEALMGVMQAGGEPAAPQSDEARRIPVVN
jgi:hypothetical protein